MDKSITVMYQYIHKEFYILPRPSKAMTQGKSQYMQKEVHILSRPSKLQPMLPDCGTPPLQSMANYSIASPLQLITQCTSREKDLPQLPSTLGAQEIIRPDKNSSRGKETCQRRGTLNSRYTNLCSTQTKYKLGTSYSCKPMYHKLLLDHAREVYRTAKSIQENKIDVKDQMNPDRS